MGSYDAEQACLNGHQITSRYHESLNVGNHSVIMGLDFICVASKKHYSCSGL